MNNDTLFNIIGYFGSGFLTIMMIPQVVTSYKTKKVDDISFLFVFLNLMAVSCLIPYSLYFGLYPVLAANFSVGICNLLLVFLKIYILNKRKDNNNDSEEVTNLEMS